MPPLSKCLLKNRHSYCRDVMEEKLMQANPAYGEMIRSGALGRLELVFLQQQTYQLYRVLLMDDDAA